MKVSAQIKISDSESEKIILTCKKSFNGKWQCKYKYTKIKDEVECSVSSRNFCEDRNSTVFYAVKYAQIEIENCLNGNCTYHKQFLVDVWKNFNKHQANKRKTIKISRS